jgi:hypothetical protein
MSENAGAAGALASRNGAALRRRAKDKKLYKSVLEHNPWLVMGPGDEEIVGVVVILLFCGVAIYRAVLWLTSAPRTPDPWGDEVEAALNQGEAVPLCHHCLAPQEHNGWFCPACGSTTGPYSNYLPFVYIFSQGEALRSGVAQRVRRSPLVVAGYFLFSLSLFGIVAPVYWFFLLRNLQHNDGLAPAPYTSVL